MGAFYDCRSLKEFQVPNKVKSLKIPFERCSGLEVLNYGEGVENLDSVGLEGVTNLKKVVLNNNLKYVPESTFLKCSQLEEIEINGTQRIDYGLFKGKSSIKKIVIDGYEINLNESEKFFSVQKSENKVALVIQDEKGNFKTKCINLERKSEKEIENNLYLSETGNLCFARDNIAECSLEFLENIKRQGQTHIYIYGASRHTNPTEYKNKINYDLYTIDDLIEIKTKINDLKQNITIPPKDDTNKEKKIYSQIVTQLSKMIEYDYYEYYVDSTRNEKNKEVEQKEIATEYEKITGKSWDEYYGNNKDRNKLEAQLQAGNLLGLLSGKAVCRGNAEIIRNIVAEFGIEATVILGAKHAWNQVKLDGQWYDDDFTSYEGYLAQDKLATSSQRFLCGEENGKSEFASIDLYKKSYTKINKVGKKLSRDEKKTFLNYGRAKQQTVEPVEKKQEKEKSIRDEVGDEHIPETKAEQQEKKDAEAEWMNRIGSVAQEVDKTNAGVNGKQEVVRLARELDEIEEKEKQAKLQKEQDQLVQ